MADSTSTSYRDLRDEADTPEYLRCSFEEVPGDKNYCDRDAYIVPENFPGKEWFGDAWCDKHDPRKAVAS